ncbi:MAG: hypothetical protein WA921_14470 [Ahrensia sp.]
MVRLAYIITVGLVGALLVHLLIVFMIPRTSTQTAWAVVSEAAQPLEVLTISADGPSENVGYMRTALCRYDLVDGAFSLRVQGSPLFWSVAVHNSTGDVLFSANDRIVTADGLDLVVANPGQIRTIRQEVPDEVSNSVIVNVEGDLGFVLLRVFEPNDSYRPVSVDFINSIQCDYLDL